MLCEKVMLRHCNYSRYRCSDSCGNFADSILKTPARPSARIVVSRRRMAGCVQLLCEHNGIAKRSKKKEKVRQPNLGA